MPLLDTKDDGCGATHNAALPTMQTRSRSLSNPNDKNNWPRMDGRDANKIWPPLPSVARAHSGGQWSLHFTLSLINRVACRSACGVCLYVIIIGIMLGEAPQLFFYLDSLQSALERIKTWWKKVLACDYVIHSVGPGMSYAEESRRGFLLSVFFFGTPRFADRYERSRRN